MLQINPTSFCPPYTKRWPFEFVMLDILKMAYLIYWDEFQQ